MGYDFTTILDRRGQDAIAVDAVGAQHPLGGLGIVQVDGALFAVGAMTGIGDDKGEEGVAGGHGVKGIEQGREGAISEAVGNAGDE